MTTFQQDEQTSTQDMHWQEKRIRHIDGVRILTGYSYEEYMTLLVQEARTAAMIRQEHCKWNKRRVTIRNKEC